MVLGNPCTDTAFVSTLVASSTSTFASPQTFNTKAPTTQTFMTAMTAALANQTTLSGAKPAWTVVYGGTLDVTISAQFQVIPTIDANFNKGGMVLAASVTAYNANGNVLMKGVATPDANQLVWTQALYTNFGVAGATPKNPANTLDDYTTNKANEGIYANPVMALPVPKGGTKKGQYTVVPPTMANGNNTQPYADPIYAGQTDPAVQMYKTGTNTITFQSAVGVNQLLDVPGWYYETPASFRAIALLSAVNTTTDVITVFNDGVNYGFDLNYTAVKTPEPSLRIVSSLFFAMLFIAYRRRGGA